ncbi:hypothetical protein BJ546DRAFT_971937 [Cryomyces antarcticus]
MPLKALRPGQSDRDLRRRSTFDFFRHNEELPRADPTKNASASNFLSPDRALLVRPKTSSNDGISSGSELGTSSEDQRPNTPPVQALTANTRRFSMLRFRHASDSQLSTRAKAQAMKDPVPPIPAAPSIVTTAPPTNNTERPSKRKQRFLPFHRSKLSSESGDSSHSPRRKSADNRQSNDSRWSQDVASLGIGKLRDPRLDLDEPNRFSTASASRIQVAPPAYGDETNSSLALPVSRLSESSRSDGSADHVTYATTTTTHTVQTTTTFFRLPRRNKRTSLFPLPVKISPPDIPNATPATPRASTGAASSSFPHHSPTTDTPPLTALRRPPDWSERETEHPSPLPSPSALGRSSLSFVAPGSTLFRKNSTTSAHSARSSPALDPPMKFPGLRNRSSTMSFLNRKSGEASPSTPPTPPTQSSGRNSTSTGRASFGTLLSMARFRQMSEPHSPQHGSVGFGLPGNSDVNSKNNSFAMSREAFVIPEREEGDTPVKYLERLEQAVSRRVIASILSKTNDPFAHSVLRSYMRKFAFFGEPIDMAVRKLLMEAELPKETQQIDRVVQGFADRYHECNPGIYISSDQAYYIAFSLIILQTDVFNKNNKRKMQRLDYIKNTSRDQDISDEILGCFYDNISYTPFIHIDDDIDINGERIPPHKLKKTSTRGTLTDPIKKPSGPIDPYNLILEKKLDILRPSLKDSINMDDPYSYLGTAVSLDLQSLQSTFFKSGVLQVLSVRSRPDAFTTQATIDNPGEAQAGVVDIKVTKVGILWRKSVKKKKTRSPWQEWEAILTGSQLYFFKNAGWVRSLVHQHDVHEKHGHNDTPVVFKPALHEFKPDALMKTDDAVALRDSSYTKHKNAFVFVRHGGQEELFLADNEGEMNDWLGKINYAAAFRSAGVRMRGLQSTSTQEAQNGQESRKPDASSTIKSVQTPTGEVTIRSGKIDSQLARQILTARRQIMNQRILEAEKEIADSNGRLEIMLRNARHLQILAPIQPKTRELVISAAARLDANLKWKRRDLWRVKCHRDILQLDLDEEQRSVSDTSTASEVQAAPSGSSPTAVAKKGGLSRLSSKSSIITNANQSPRSPVTTVRLDPTSSRNGDAGFGDDFLKTPPEQASPAQLQLPWHLPPLSMDPQRGQQTYHRGSIASSTALSPQSARPNSLAHQSSTSSVRNQVSSPVMSDTASRLATPIAGVDDREQEILAQAGLLAENEKRPETASESDRDFTPSGFKTGTPGTRSKVRRSLHKTLRETRITSGHSHRRGKDSSSSAMTADTGSEKLENEGLSRAKGSFTVHGKKASVITFGSEWQNMTAEDRLKVRKQGHGDGDAPFAVPNAIDDESAVAEDGDSTASHSTATARSWTRDADVPAAYSRAREYDGPDYFSPREELEQPQMLRHTVLRSHSRSTDASSILEKGDEEDARFAQHTPTGHGEEREEPERLGSPRMQVVKG